MALAQAIVRRGMREPAIFLLEAHKPFTTALHTLLQVSRPLLVALAGNAWASALEETCRSREDLERFIALLEEGRPA